MNNNYEYKGQPLSKSAAIQILDEVFSGQIPITEIVRKVAIQHVKKGGLPPEDDARSHPPLF